jgi:hypothetical protein
MPLQQEARSPEEQLWLPLIPSTHLSSPESLVDSSPRASAPKLPPQSQSASPQKFLQIPLSARVKRWGRMFFLAGRSVLRRKPSRRRRLPER